MWDDDDSSWFDGFSEAMFWFFTGPLWLYILILLAVAGVLWYF